MSPSRWKLELVDHCFEGWRNTYSGLNRISPFFTFLILPKQLVRSMSMMSPFSYLFFYLFSLLTTIVTQTKFIVMFTLVYILVVAVYITTNSNNTHKSITLPRYNTNLHTHNQHETFLNDAYEVYMRYTYEVYRYNVSRNHLTHIMLHSSHKQTMNTK